MPKESIIKKEIRAVGKNLVVKPFEHEETMSGLIYDAKSKIILPNNWNKNRLVCAKVLSKGPRVTVDTKEGDTVICFLQSGIETYDLRVVHEDIVYAVLIDQEELNEDK